MSNDPFENPKNTDLGTLTPAEFLRTLFLERKARNPLYSTRAFARDLGMSQALVSLIMNGKRPLTAKQAARVSAALGHSAEETSQLLRIVTGIPSPTDQLRPISYRSLDAERFRIISQWYHIAILDLATTHTFRPDPVWIAKRLGINPVEAQDAIERLITLQFLERTPTGFKKCESNIFFVSEKPDHASRLFHRQMMEKAASEMDSTSREAFEARLISGLTLAIPRSAIAHAKERIERFKREMTTFCESETCDEVYQLNVQFFSLTREVKET